MEYKENSKPIYLQIADRLCDEVMADRYSSGERIPSVREAAGHYQVNANTMMRVYEHLAGRQIIHNQRGIGFFISEQAKEQIEKMRQETFYNDELAYFFGRLDKMGVTAEHLSKLYTDFINKTSGLDR